MIFPGAAIDALLTKESDPFFVHHAHTRRSTNRSLERSSNMMDSDGEESYVPLDGGGGVTSISTN